MSEEIPPVDPSSKAKISKQAYEDRHVKITVRFKKGKEELDLLNEYAKKTGFKLHQYIRKVVLQPRIKLVELPPKVTIETKIQVLKVGNNINQIARHLNTYREIPADIREQFKVIIQQLQDILKELTYDTNHREG